MSITDSVKVRDENLVDILESILNSPYINVLLRQFILTAFVKLASRTTTSQTQQQRILALLEGFSASQELEIQQRAVEFVNLYAQHSLIAGVLERMPPPEIKATVIGIGTCITATL